MCGLLFREVTVTSRRIALIYPSAPTALIFRVPREELGCPIAPCIDERSAEVELRSQARVRVGATPVERFGVYGCTVLSTLSPDFEAGTLTAIYTHLEASHCAVARVKNTSRAAFASRSP